MSLLVVGTVAFDALETPFGKVDRTLGGAATYFALAASYFTDEHVAIFRGRRIDISGLERAAGKSFFWAGRYGIDPNERVTLATELNVLASFRPKLPESYRSAKHVFLANIDPTLQRLVLEQIKGKPRMVALD